jgi:tRNA dimethylallyltransferase
MNRPRIYVVGGPTASGKTQHSIKLAKALNTEIISFDSRQFYREMHIGTARPMPHEFEGVTHHFLGSHSLIKPLDAVAFAFEARPILNSLLENKGNAVLVGGSGFYLNALLFDLDEMPAIPAPIRQQVNRLSLQELQTQVEAVDPVYFKETDIQNPARLRRALEVWLSSKKPWSAFRKAGLEKKEWGWNAELQLIFLNPERKELHGRIAERTRNMLQLGLKAEALRLREYQTLPVMNTVGYQEWYAQQGESDSEIEARINAHTRQYARRQITWFSKFENQVQGLRFP